MAYAVSLELTSMTSEPEPKRHKAPLAQAGEAPEAACRQERAHQAYGDGRRAQSPGKERGRALFEKAESKTKGKKGETGKYRALLAFADQGFIFRADNAPAHFDLGKGQFAKEHCVLAVLPKKLERIKGILQRAQALPEQSLPKAQTAETAKHVSYGGSRAVFFVMMLLHRSTSRLFWLDRRLREKHS